MIARCILVAWYFLSSVLLVYVAGQTLADGALPVFGSDLGRKALLFVLFLGFAALQVQIEPLIIAGVRAIKRTPPTVAHVLDPDAHSLSGHVSATEVLRLLRSSTPTGSSAIHVSCQLEARLQRRRRWLWEVEEPAATADYAIRVETTASAAADSAPLLQGQLMLEHHDAHVNREAAHITYAMVAADEVLFRTLLQRALASWYGGDVEAKARLCDWAHWQLPRQAFDGAGQYHGLRCVSLEQDTASTLDIGAGGCV